MLSREAEIIINGNLLTEAQSATLRVSLNSFIQEMKEAGALGGDKVGLAIAKRYRERGIEIQELMHKEH